MLVGVGGKGGETANQALAPRTAGVQAAGSGEACGCDEAAIESYGSERAGTVQVASRAAATAEDGLPLQGSWMTAHSCLGADRLDAALRSC